MHSEEKFVALKFVMVVILRPIPERQFNPTPIPRILRNSESLRENVQVSYRLITEEDALSDFISETLIWFNITKSLAATSNKHPRL